MFKIESLLSKHLIAVFGLIAVLCLCVAGTGCAGVTAAPKSASTSTSASVQVTPSTVTLQLGATQQFSANSSGVTWSATGGTISSSGMYTAPTTPGTYVVQATSTADTSQSGSAAVTVVSNSTTPQISFSPAQLSFSNVAVNATGTQTLAHNQRRGWHAHHHAVWFHGG